MNASVTRGDYLYTPPNATHSVYSKTGCVMLFVVPEEVEVLKLLNDEST